MIKTGCQFDEIIFSFYIYKKEKLIRECYYYYYRRSIDVSWAIAWQSSFDLDYENSTFFSRFFPDSFRNASKCFPIYRWRFCTGILKIKKLDESMLAFSKHPTLKRISPTGNWTRVSCVTDRNTNHYTIEDYIYLTNYYYYNHLLPTIVFFNSLAV